MPEQVDVAPMAPLNPQNLNGNNTEMEKFLDDGVKKLKSGVLGQLPWDHEENYGKQWAWYMMANKAKFYLNQVSDLYNKNSTKHTVMLTFVDQKEDWTEK